MRKGALHHTHPVSSATVTIARGQKANAPGSFAPGGIGSVGPPDQVMPAVRLVQAPPYSGLFASSCGMGRFTSVP